MTYVPGVDPSRNSDPDVELQGNNLLLMYNHPTAIAARVPQAVNVQLHEVGSIPITLPDSR